MNERIRELKQQAAREVVNDSTWHISTDEQWNDAVSGKFAELLLTEVMSTINNMDRYSGDRDVDDIAEALARHFGVK